MFFSGKNVLSYLHSISAAALQEHGLWQECFPGSGAVKARALLLARAHCREWGTWDERREEETFWAEKEVGFPADQAHSFGAVMVPPQGKAELMAIN